MRTFVGHVLRSVDIAIPVNNAEIFAIVITGDDRGLAHLVARP